MKSIKVILLQALLLSCLFSTQASSTETKINGLVGLSSTSALTEYSFYLPESATISLDLRVLSQSTGDLEATLLLAQGVNQYAKVALNKKKSITLEAGEYQLMLYTKLLDAQFAHLKVEVSNTIVYVNDVVALLDPEVSRANMYRSIQKDFTLPSQELVSLSLVDYAFTSGFPPELQSPLLNTFFSLSNKNTNTLIFFGGLEGLENVELRAGDYQLQVHIVADLQAHSINKQLISGLGWSLTSSTINFSDLELINSKSISAAESNNAYNLGLVDFGEGDYYDFSLHNALGFTVEEEKVIFVPDGVEGSAISINGDSPNISSQLLSGVYQAYAFIPEGKAGALQISIQRSGSSQPYWAKILPTGEVRVLDNITVSNDSQVVVEIKDLGFSNGMQSAEFVLTNGLDSFSFSLAEGSSNLGQVVRAGNYALLALTEAEGNALVYLELQTDAGLSLYQDYVFEGRGGFYSEAVALAGGEYSLSAKDHALPALGNSYSAVLLQKGQLLYKHQSFGNGDLFESGLIDLVAGEYVLGYAADASEIGTMVLGYKLSASTTQAPLEPANPDRSLGEGGNRSGGGSFGYSFLGFLFILRCSRSWVCRRNKLIRAS